MGLSRSEVGGMLRELGREWRADRASGLAAEIAFFGLLSLFPGLLAVAAALGSLDAIASADVAERAQDGIVDFLERVLTSEASGTIEAVERIFTASSPGLFTIGLVLALWSASRGFAAVINALDVAYDIEERRSYLRVRALALGLSLGSIVVLALMLAMLVVGPLLGTGQDVADELGLRGAFVTFWDWVRWPVAVVVLVAWAATVLHVAPSRRTPWRWNLPGAALAALSWVLLSLGFRLYLMLAGSANEVFGTLGGGLIVLLWLYLLGAGLLVGGELNAILAVRYGVRELPDRAKPRWWRFVVDRLRAARRRVWPGGDRR